MRRLLLPLVAALLVLLFGAGTAAAIPPVTRPPAGGEAYPAPGACVDTAGELSTAVCTKVTAVLAADEKATTDEIAVAVVPSTGGVPIERWATGLYNEWGVGKTGEDNGVLLVIAVRDRALRLVTGDGMRSRLPDWQASEIVGGTITPLMKAGRTEDAVLAGLDAVRRAIGHQVDPANALASPDLVIPTSAVDPFATTEDEPESSGGDALPLILLVVGICVVGFFVTWLRGGLDGGGSSYGSGSSYDSGYRRRSSYRSFGSSSRSSSSSRSGSSSRRSGFGGGRSSGGGASGSW